VHRIVRVDLPVEQLAEELLEPLAVLPGNFEVDDRITHVPSSWMRWSAKAIARYRYDDELLRALRGPSEEPSEAPELIGGLGHFPAVDHRPGDLTQGRHTGSLHGPGVSRAADWSANHHRHVVERRPEAAAP